MLCAEVGGRDVLDPAQRIVWVSRDPALVKDDRAVAVGGGRDHPERQPLRADVLAQLVEVHQPSERLLQRFGVQDRRGVQAAHRQKLADVAREPSHPARRHQRREHVPKPQLAPEAQPVLDRLLNRTMPVGRQIRRDQRARARPDDHPHLILKLAQQHRQRPGRVRPTRPAPTQHQTRAAPSITLHAHDPKPTRITATRATRPRLNRIAAPAARRGHQPARRAARA